MGWVPKNTPYDARKPGECTTFELNAFLDYGEEQLARDDLEPRQREGLREWLRELLAEKDQRAVMAEQAKQRIAAARATGRQS